MPAPVVEPRPPRTRLALRRARGGAGGVIFGGVGEDAELGGELRVHARCSPYVRPKRNANRARWFLSVKDRGAAARATSASASNSVEHADALGIVAADPLEDLERGDADGIEPPGQRLAANRAQLLGQRRVAEGGGGRQADLAVAGPAEAAQDLARWKPSETSMTGPSASGPRTGREKSAFCSVECASFSAAVAAAGTPSSPRAPASARRRAPGRRALPPVKSRRGAAPALKSATAASTRARVCEPRPYSSLIGPPSTIRTRAVCVGGRRANQTALATTAAAVSR